MGKLEEKSKKRSKAKNLQKIVISSIATAGVLSVGLLAPNVLGAMAKLGIMPRQRQEEYIRSSASKMVKKGFLKFNGKYYELTETGKEKLRIWEFSDFKIKKPKKWDNKWRVIIFDIPNNKRKSRDRLRVLFKNAGFYLLQKSVWVYPYDCEDIIGLLKSELGIGKNLLYLIVEEIEDDKRLREEFGL